jgi:hypothetical protein
MNATDNRQKLVSATRGATVAAAGTALAATFLIVTACGSGNNSGTSSTSVASSSAAASTASSAPSTASSAPTTTAAGHQYDQQALQILDAIVRGDFSGATAHFDSPMKATVTPEVLASDWATYQQQFGKYESHGDPEDVARDDLTVVNIPLEMAVMRGQFRVTFHNTDGTVAGLYFLKAGVPVP